MKNELDPRIIGSDSLPAGKPRQRANAAEEARGMRSTIALMASIVVGALIGIGFAFNGTGNGAGAGGDGSAQISAPVLARAPILDIPALTFVTADGVAPLPVLRRTEARLEKRDTLTDLMDRIGADRAEANAALYSLYDNGLIDPRRLRPGLAIEATFDESSNALLGLVIRPDSDRALTVARSSTGGYTARETRASLTPTYRRVSGSVTTSLYEAALAGGARDQQVVDFAEVFAYDVDFQREIREGDQFEMVYEAFVDERGNPVRNGEVVYASLNGYATNRAFYLFTPSDDDGTDYFDRAGESATKFLMKTPINGARLSSSFGMRRHPISGYTKLHKGTDFAAPTGTPVYAAGNGVIVRASRNGGYGNYVRIQHANGYETAYAHLSGYGPGIREGVRVRQGQVIGFVGSTGASTGPHLHYEVLYNGNQVDAMQLRLPTGRKLDGLMLDDFQVARTAMDAIRKDLGAELDIASANLPGPDATR